MNSEELEQSLRAEFENYLKGVIAEMRNGVTEFQVKINNEFEKHRSQIDDAFKDFSANFESEHDFDSAFRESVVEHLRLARDDGAKITATAIAEAEELERASAPQFNLSDIKDALNEISSKESQSAILKSLIHHAADHTPRGAFFIIKSEHFVGWKVFGKEAGEGESAVRDIHFPVEADSVLGAAVRRQSISEGSFGTFAEDAEFLDPLHFGQPDRMYAIPLVARGRAVAVLYADYGHEGVTVNTDALEMLVRVAGLTVEMLASAKAVRTGIGAAVTTGLPETGYETDEHLADEHEADEHGMDARPFETEASDYEFSSSAPEIAEETSGEEQVETHDHSPFETEASVYDFSSTPEIVEEASSDEQIETADEPTFEHHVEPEVGYPEPVAETEYDSFDISTAEPAVSFDREADSFIEQIEPVAEQDVDEYSLASDHETAREYVPESAASDLVEEAEQAQTFENAEFEKTEPIVDFPAVSSAPIDETVLSQELSSFDAAETRREEVVEEDTADDTNEPAIVFDSIPVVEEVSGFDASPFDQPVEKFEPAGVLGSAIPVSSSPVVERVATPTSGTRLSDRHVDLPIEVAEDERRLHNDARRFARLLVSEIKLYNEKKVTEGRESSDLYERLREAIDRSREMYDKRVQPPVASKFDYFHYELVNSLAEGDEARLGSSYKGAKV